MKLGKYFTLEELTATKTGLLNIPSTAERVALSELVSNILDPLREHYGKPIKINSGFRSKAVNTVIKGAPTSQHMKGEAADIDTGFDNAKLFHIIKDHFIFDQLIWEGGDNNCPAWVHVSYKTQGNRGEVLKMKNGKYTKWT